MTDSSPNVCVNPGCGQELPPIHAAAGYGEEELGDRLDAEITECPSCKTTVQRTAPSDPRQLHLH